MTGLKIENSIDLHCHFRPDHLGGKAIENGVDCRTGTSPIESAKAAIASGQAGAVLKSHSFASTALVSALNGVFPELRLFSGICTDYISGGLNIDAVDAALRMGAKIVWLPTLHSVNDIEGGNITSHPGPGIAVIDDAGKPVDAVHQIFELVQQHDAILATGHTSAAEHYGVIREFARRGKVVVTHAGEPAAGPKLTAAQCVELADLGAIIEFTAMLCHDGVAGATAKSPLQAAEMIYAVGADRCVLATDYGFMKGIPDPVPGFADFLERLWSEGEVAEKDLIQMASRKPAELLGISF
ncbi:hypothetical protein HFP15_22000 [Amycolatopsis sp. K13G38]|uniref:Amidohydrolase n=1 Tax=Amycolatopsis acididurans TaxID=2724524 RepID=A0ABX1JAX4_9PSEU|nr:DUF6282 family protein [Amycolatopsis acididurans]NKQ55561.1 hypothetical protein [Amycolatopsis acididurans]